MPVLSKVKTQDSTVQNRKHKTQQQQHTSGLLLQHQVQINSSMVPPLGVLKSISQFLQKTDPQRSFLQLKTRDLRCWFLIGSRSLARRVVGCTRDVGLRDGHLANLLDMKGGIDLFFRFHGLDYLSSLMFIGIERGMGTSSVIVVAGPYFNLGLVNVYKDSILLTEPCEEGIHDVVVNYLPLLELFCDFLIVPRQQFVPAQMSTESFHDLGAKLLLEEGLPLRLCWSLELESGQIIENTSKVSIVTRLLGILQKGIHLSLTKTLIILIQSVPPFMPPFHLLSLFLTFFSLTSPSQLYYHNYYTMQSGQQAQCKPKYVKIRHHIQGKLKNKLFLANLSYRQLTAKIKQGFGLHSEKYYRLRYSDLDQDSIDVSGEDDYSTFLECLTSYVLELEETESSFDDFMMSFERGPVGSQGKSHPLEAEEKDRCLEQVQLQLCEVKEELRAARVTIEEQTAFIAEWKGRNKFDLIEGKKAEMAAQLKQYQHEMKDKLTQRLEDALEKHLLQQQQQNKSSERSSKKVDVEPSKEASRQKDINLVKQTLQINYDEASTLASSHPTASVEQLVSIYLDGIVQ